MTSKTPKNTARAYAADWRAWEAWCASRGVEPWPIEDAQFARWLSSMSRGADGAQLRPSTIRRRLAGVASTAISRGAEDPRKGRHFKELQARLKQRPRIGGEAEGPTVVTEHDLVAMCAAQPTEMPLDLLDRDALGTWLRALRDRAWLALTYATGLRMADAQELTVRLVKLWPDGSRARVHIWHMRTGRESVHTFDRRPDWPACPVDALGEWLAGSRLPAGAPLFPAVTTKGRMSLSPMRRQAAGEAVKRAEELAGIVVGTYTPRAIGAPAREAQA